MSTPSRIVRPLMALALLVGGAALQQPPARPARAAAPSITVSPTSVVPHGQIQVSGTGFDAGTSAHQVMVDIAIVNSAGTFPLGVMQADGQGTIGTGAAPLTLPFGVDVTGNQITATEEGNSSLTGSFAVSGVLLQPQLNGGQALAARPGDQLNLNGSGFAPGDVVQVTLDGTSLATAAGGTTITADASGGLSVPLAIPAGAQPGAHALTVAGAARGAGQKDLATITLTIGSGSGPAASGNLTLNPSTAAVGTTVTATGTGFQPNEPVTFTLKYFDVGLRSYAIQNSPATADVSGTATALIHIPASADGSKPATVTAIGITSGITIAANLTFAALAQLTVDPPTALPGARIVVSGSGLVPNERLFVTTRLFTPPPTGLGVVDATGHFSATVTILGGTAPGSLVVAVSGSGGDNASAYFTVAQQVPAAIQVAPAGAAAGSTVTVTGRGFGPQEAVAFSAGGASLGQTGPLSPTDALGVLTATVTLAAGLNPGQYTLQAKGLTSGIGAAANITVTGALTNRWYFAEGFTGQGPKVFFQETLTLLNPGNKGTAGTITYQFPDGSTEALPISLKARSVLVEDVNGDVGPNRIASATIETDAPIVAQRTILRTDAARRPLDSDYSPGQSAAEPTWYFAEGYSGVTFQPYLTVQNPNVAPITMTVTLYSGHGPAKLVRATLTPFGRYTLNLRSALPGKSFGIKVDAAGPVVAERVEYWGDGSGSAKFGAGVKPGVPLPQRAWYFGYAAILGGDQAYISVLNPNGKAAHVQARFFDGTGNPEGTAKLTAGPNQRGTFTLQSLLGKHPHSPVAAIITGDLPVVAEEAQYFGGSPNRGSHAGASIEGRAAPATRWLFAAGDTARYREMEYVFNPNATPTTVTARFIGADGQVVTASYAAPPRRVITIWANAVPGLHRGVHGSVWTTAGSVKVVVAQMLLGAHGSPALADQGIPG